MLGYKVSKEYCEIMMTHCGSNVSHWIGHIDCIQNRIDFAADMLRQVIVALKTVHNLGYSHADIKPENVCAR